MINRRSVTALHRACLHQQSKPEVKAPDVNFRPNLLETDMTADGEHQIPSDRPQDHLSIELPTFERLTLPYLCCSSPSRHATTSTRLDR
jgi:hypothetical protein